MASFNEDMRSHVAGSMNDRPAPAGSSGDARFPGEPPGDGTPGGGPEAARGRQPDPPRPDRRRPPPAPDRVRPRGPGAARGQPQGPGPAPADPGPLGRRGRPLCRRRRRTPLRAARLAGMESIACVVATGDATPEDILEDQLVENALREDLRPVEQARAYRALLSARGLTHRQLADRLQIGHASIARALALLELPGPIQAEVEAGTIAPNTAYELSRVSDPEEQAEPRPPGRRGPAPAG